MLSGKVVELLGNIITSCLDSIIELDELPVEVVELSIDVLFVLSEGPFMRDKALGNIATGLFTSKPASDPVLDTSLQSFLSNTPVFIDMGPA